MGPKEWIFFSVVSVIFLVGARYLDEAMETDLKDKHPILRIIHKFMYVAIGIGMTAIYAHLSAG